MSYRLTKKETFVMLMLLLVIAGGVLTFQLFLMNPLQETIETKEAELKQEVALLSALEANINHKQEKAFQGTMELQKKLPVKPQLEQFLLDLDKAETISGSFISSMSFGEKATTGTTNLFDQYIREQQEIVNKETNVNDDDSKNTEQLTDEALFPEGMERLMVHLTVESPSYFELEAFLKALENLSRITKIDNLNFSSNGEAVTTENTMEKLTYTLTVSTFYFPKLTELKAQLPTIDVPNSSEKLNPLIPFSRVDVKEQTLSESEEETSNRPNNSENVDETSLSILEHIVEHGETLYSISQKYYKSRSGEQTILEWNKLPNKTVYTGQVIEIPLQK